MNYNVIVVTDQGVKSFFGGWTVLTKKPKLTTVANGTLASVFNANDTAANLAALATAGFTAVSVGVA